VDQALDPSFFGDCGVPASEVLLRFTEAVLSRRGIGEVQRALVDALGDDAMWEAAATIAAFTGLVRVADGTGIVLDDGVLALSADLRARAGIDAFGGALNSGPAPRSLVELTDVAGLFK
jgi:hypothetical protein